jgi:hypothetical protein
MLVVIKWHIGETQPAQPVTLNLYSFIFEPEIDLKPVNLKTND